MKSVDRRIRHVFVEFVPSVLEERVLYISMAFATSTHLCACGCGNKVVTPFTPTDWSLLFDGDTVSLDPSIGNWSFPCRSHYWITRGTIAWAPQWSSKRIAAAQTHDAAAKADYFHQQNAPGVDGERTEDTKAKGLSRFWQRLRRRR